VAAFDVRARPVSKIWGLGLGDTVFCTVVGAILMVACGRPVSCSFVFRAVASASLVVMLADAVPARISVATSTPVAWTRKWALAEVWTSVMETMVTWELATPLALATASM